MEYRSHWVRRTICRAHRLIMQLWSGSRFRLGGALCPDLDLQRRDRRSARGNLSLEEAQPMPGALLPVVRRDTTAAAQGFGLPFPNVLHYARATAPSK